MVITKGPGLKRGKEKRGEEKRGEEKSREDKRSVEDMARADLAVGPLWSPSSHTPNHVVCLWIYSGRTQTDYCMDWMAFLQGR